MNINMYINDNNYLVNSVYSIHIRVAEWIK